VIVLTRVPNGQGDIVWRWHVAGRIEGFLHPSFLGDALTGSVDGGNWSLQVKLAWWVG